MYCPQCGAQNIAEARFCRLCGTAFQVLAKPAQPLAVRPNYRRALRPLFMGLFTVPWKPPLMPGSALPDFTSTRGQ